MNDLISREEAIDAVKFDITYAKAFNKETGEVIELFKETNATLEKVAERIRMLPASEQWIHVSDRLPEHQQEVVIKTKIGVTEVMRFCNDNSVYFYRFGIDESMDWYKPNEVEVWMPLPERYKEGV